MIDEFITVAQDVFTYQISFKILSYATKMNDFKSHMRDHFRMWNKEKERECNLRLEEKLSL